ncbi:MAG: hypothetical protein R2825_15450 [Saprospiraceae bacterium]
MLTLTALVSVSIDALPFHATTPTDQVPDNESPTWLLDTALLIGVVSEVDFGLEYYFSNDLSAFFQLFMGQ